MNNIFYLLQIIFISFENFPKKEWDIIFELVVQSVIKTPLVWLQGYFMWNSLKERMEYAMILTYNFHIIFWILF